MRDRGLERGTPAGLWFDPNVALDEGKLEVTPGVHALVSSNSGSTRRCAVPVVARTAPVEVAAGAPWLAVPVGETLGELRLQAVKLQRQ